MKKYFLSVGLMVAAAFTLTNCTQEIDAPVEPSVDGVPFEIVAKSADTKTVNNGLETVWVEGDAINLFHEYAGSEEYVKDGEFTYEGGDVFKGTLAEELEEDAIYYWYAIYPYSSYVKTPASTSGGYLTVASAAGGSQLQKGNNSMDHIAGENYPLAGVSKEDVEYCEGDQVEIQMNHLTCLLEVVVTNNTAEDLTVSTVAFSAPENIVGTYYLNIVGDETVFTSSGDSFVSKTASLKVEDAEALANGQSAKYYLAVKPFTAAAGKKLALVVNGRRKEVTVSKDMVFNASEVVTLNFSYEEAPESPALSLPWYEDFSDKDLSDYVIVNGESETKLYMTENGEDLYAGGESPEILIGKKNGSFSVNVATNGYVGDLALIFKSNHPDYIEVTSVGADVTKVTDSEYLLTVSEGVNQLTVTLKNIKDSNTRVDDIEIARPRTAQILTFAEDVCNVEVGSVASFTGQTVSGAQTKVTYVSSKEEVAIVDPETGEVTLTGVYGTAVITAAAEQTSEYKFAEASYSITVIDPGAVVVEKDVTLSFIDDATFQTWDTGYKARTLSYDDATVKFESANRQTGTITNMPVTKGKSVEIIMNENRTLKYFKLQLKQWGTKAQTVTLHYSMSEGSSYTQTNTTSSNFVLEGELPEGVNAIKFTFSSTSNQVGIQSCDLTFDVVE